MHNSHSLYRMNSAAASTMSHPATKATAAVDSLPQLSPLTVLPALTQANRDRLILDNMQTVQYIARRMHDRLPRHVELEELISAGLLGLIDAVDKFDHSKQILFKSYAQYRIRGAILDSLRTLDWSPRDLRRKGRAIEEVIRSLTAELGRSPSEQEIATEMALGIDEYQQILGELKGLEIGSLNMERSEESGEEEMNYVPGPDKDNPLFQCMESEMRSTLMEAIDALPEKERLVLTLYYYEELTMKEIGQTIGVVESRVSQIRTAAVLKLRSALGAPFGTAKSSKTPERREQA